MHLSGSFDKNCDHIWLLGSEIQKHLNNTLIHEITEKITYEYILSIQNLRHSFYVPLTLDTVYY